MNKELAEIRAEIETLEILIVIGLLNRFRFIFINPEKYSEENLQFAKELDENLFRNYEINLLKEKKEVIFSKIIEYYFPLIERNQQKIKEGVYKDINLAMYSEIFVLRHIINRIFLGVKVAKAKYQHNKEAYIELIKKRDRENIIKLLTDQKREEEVINNVKKIGSQYINAFKLEITPEILSNLYTDLIIPLTKEVEVEYLFLQK